MNTYELMVEQENFTFGSDRTLGVKSYSQYYNITSSNLYVKLLFSGPKSLFSKCTKCNKGIYKTSMHDGTRQVVRISLIQIS